MSQGLEALIREFREEDAQEVSNLVLRILREVNSQHYSPSQIEAMISLALPMAIKENSEVGQVYVAIQDGKIVGTVTLILGGIFTTDISMLFVDTAYQKRGIGRRLMQEAEIRAKSEHTGKLELSSTINAVGFYEKLGYRRIGEDNSQPIGKTIKMEKKL